MKLQLYQHNKLLLLTVYVLAVLSSVSCLTPLPSQIHGNLTLRYDQSPYVAEHDVYVHRKARLIVEPGCEIRFAKGRQLHVNGILEARGTPDRRILFTKSAGSIYFGARNYNNYNNETRSTYFESNAARSHVNNFRLVEGETITDGKLQIFYNSKWQYVCSTSYNWTQMDVNVTCRSMGFSNGTFYYYAPANNLTSHMKVYMPGCRGHESNLFECSGTSHLEYGLTACDHQQVVGLLCEGFDESYARTVDNWGGIVFQKYAPYLKQTEFTSVFYNLSQSIMEFADIEYAGLEPYNTWLYRPYTYMPSSAITVFQYAPRFNNITVQYSIANGMNLSNIEAPAFIFNSLFRYNRGHGIIAKTRFGNVRVVNTLVHDNMGDGLKFQFNNSKWSQVEEEEYFSTRYLDYCDSQNPLSYPAYYRFRNPNYILECSKTFITESHLRITLNFQKVRIISRYSTYWMEVYDGQTDKQNLIANYTFEDNRTPQAIYSRTNNLYVKLRFQCNYPTDRKLEPIELQQLQYQREWNQMKQQQAFYEKKLYEHHPFYLPDDPRPDRPFQPIPRNKILNPLSLDQLTVREQNNKFVQYDREKFIENLEYKQKLAETEQDLRQTRIACPYSDLDEITMFAMIGDHKHPDLVLKRSHFVNNAQNGVNATNIHSVVQINESSINENHMSGLHVQAGAGDVSLYHSKVESNQMNGINITYAGGLKEFNYSRIASNGLFGIWVNYDVRQELDNLFQNTTLNSTIVEDNAYGGVYLGSYCNQSNITINASVIRNNREHGIIIEACRADQVLNLSSPIDLMNDYSINYQRWWIARFNFTHLNVSWTLFDGNRLNGLKIKGIQNMVGVMTNNTFRNHDKGALLITPSTAPDTLIRNVSLSILFNKFENNRGRYALNVGLNENADHIMQTINITFNRFDNNHMFEPYDGVLNSRSTASAVAVVSSSNIQITQNWFNNPMSRIQIATHLENHTAMINASYNWFSSNTPVYEFQYSLLNRERCNQQWLKVRDQVFDAANRSSLAEIIYWPYMCNERMWAHESSIDLRPPAYFDLGATQAFGGVYDIGDNELPNGRYNVVNDILIKPGAKLKINSGTELHFANGVGMLVLGELQVDGHLGSPVKFTLSNNRWFAPGGGVFPRMSLNETSSHQVKKRSTNETESRSRSSRNVTSGVDSANKTVRMSDDVLLDALDQSVPVPKFTVSLVDGRDMFEGRLRVQIDGVYGTVCNRGWTIVDSKIACAQMGLVLDPTLYIYTRWFENDPRQFEPILMSEVQCDDLLDTDLQKCRHTKERDHTCTHRDDVWLRCVRPGWAGVRFGLHSLPSRIQHAWFEHAGQYDYAQASLSPALQFDLLQHECTNLTFQFNRHISMEVVFSQPYKQNVVYNSDFFNNWGPGFVTRSSYVQVMQMLARDNYLYPAVEFDPFMSREKLESVRLYGSQPRRGFDVRRELTRLQDFTWFIGSEQMVMLYTDPEVYTLPREYNIQIKTDNNRVIIVELIDYNPDTTQEQVAFCERLCQQSFQDPLSREWNLNNPEQLIYFPVNTSYSVLHINYNVTGYKSGRLAFVVYTTRAPEFVYDYKNPSYYYIRNKLPDNLIRVHNSTFITNRHAVVVRHYEETLDIFKNIRRRYNYTNLVISNCTFISNDQILWVNTDPILINFNQRVNNMSIHYMHTVYESNKDDMLIGESGYQLFDLMPRAKRGPLGRMNITFEQNVCMENYAGLRALYRYYEYSNTLWHFEIRNNRYVNNQQSFLKLLLPRIDRHSVKLIWENVTHTINMRSNEFSHNRLFEISIDGYYAQINVTKNLFADNHCRLGLVKFSGTEKDFFIYANEIERNEANFVFDLEARSQADNDLDIMSLLVDNIIVQNKRPMTARQHQDYYYHSSSLFVQNSPTSYTVAVRGVQNCTIMRNIFENYQFDYELVGAMQANTLNATIDATQNWWGTYNATLVKQRIFDFFEWNNHAIVNFVPFYASKIDYSLSWLRPALTARQDFANHVIGGAVYHDMTLPRSDLPYQVRSDLTIMPGATLYIEAGAVLEFYPNIGILVLGHLKAAGAENDYIRMRPVRFFENRMPFYSDPPPGGQMIKENEFNVYTNPDPTSRLRLHSGLHPNEGFLQIYNETLRSWVWLCDHQFNLISASVACKQMNMEHRNALVKSLYYYFPPTEQPPIWNQTFVCKGGEYSLVECDLFVNHQIDTCQQRSEYVYLMCKDYNLDPKENFVHAWGGIRFAQPYFEQYTPTNQLDSSITSVLDTTDLSFMYYVEIFGAGMLHNEQTSAVQQVQRTPLLSNVVVRNSSYHGIELLHSKTTTVLSKLRVESSLGYAFSSIQLNVQTTDQKSSFKVLEKNLLSGPSGGGVWSMVDICDPNKYYEIEQRIILFYKYTNLARDCVKIFRVRQSATNIGGSGQIGIRFLQFQLVNDTIQNDTVEIYNGTLFRLENLIASVSNSSSSQQLEKFYLSRSDSLSVFMKGSPGREYNGFIAEVLIYPTAQYLLTDTYIELSDSHFYFNQLGAVNMQTAGERNPHLFVIRNRLVANGFQYYNATTEPTCDMVLQNVPKFYFGNNFIQRNWGGVTFNLHSGSGVLITQSYVYNNLFDGNMNDTVLCAKGGLQLPYNEILMDKNVFVENHTPRTDLILISGVLSKFNRNQLVYNKAMRIMYIQGFENVSTPRSQDITYNLLRDNFAYGIINELEDEKRYRSTIVAASLKQVYYGNYLFNKDNDFELTALIDPLSLAFLSQYKQLQRPKPGPEVSNYFDEYYQRIEAEYFNINEIRPDSRDRYFATTTARNWRSYLTGKQPYSGAINATYNFWGTVIDTEIRARIRDKYDNATLFEVAYSPPVLDEFKLRDGKCELGWTLIDDTCYTYVGAYVTYPEAELVCKQFEGRLARETVAPIKLPRFRKLARSSQLDYETQSYRRMWLHTDGVVVNNPSNVFGNSVLGGSFYQDVNLVCSVVEDFGVASMNCMEKLPFICEKDPVFHGAVFRFKDEIAISLAVVAALFVCLVILSILWFCKSKKRKKEHIDRKNTLRSSARTHRHMINQPAGGASTSTLSSSSNKNIISATSNRTGPSQFSTLNSKTQHLSQTTTSGFYGSHIGGAGGQSVDSLTIASTTRSTGRLAPIYASQRNQYFANKKRTRSTGGGGGSQSETEIDTSTLNEESQLKINKIFNGTGLDSSSSVNVQPYNNNILVKPIIREEDINITVNANVPNNNLNYNSSNIQYHALDVGSTNKNKPTMDSGEDYDDEEEDTTITDELTDEALSNSRPVPNSGGGGGSAPFQTYQHQHQARSKVLDRIQQLQLQQNSSSANDTTTTSDDLFNPPLKPSTINKEFIQARIVKKALPDNAGRKQIYDDFNSTLNSDMGDESNLLATNKVNANTDSTAKSNQNTSINLPSLMQNHTSLFGPRSDQYSRLMSNTSQNSSSNNNNNSSILSKSTTNMTNITPMASDLNLHSNVTGTGNRSTQQFDVSNDTKTLSHSSSDYENISTTALNEILKNSGYTLTGSNAANINNSNNNVSSFRPSSFGFQPPPQLLSQYKQVGENNGKLSTFQSSQPNRTRPEPNVMNMTVTDTDDAESMQSCQLITSASLLANKDIIKEARRIENKRPLAPPSMPPPPMPTGYSRAPVAFSAQRGLSGSQILVDEATQTAKNANLASPQIAAPNGEQQPRVAESTKPPPMETTI